MKFVKKQSISFGSTQRQITSGWVELAIYRTVNIVIGPQHNQKCKYGESSVEGTSWEDIKSEVKICSMDEGSGHTK